MNPPELIQDLAKQRAEGTTSLFLSWSQSLTALPLLPEEVLRKIALALPSPIAARQFATSLSREPDPVRAVNEWLQAVAESHEELKDWLSAFGVFAAYIDGTSHRPGLMEAMGYLHCCEVVIESGPRYATFAQTVETMLSTYGYEGSSSADPEEKD